MASVSHIHDAYQALSSPNLYANTYTNGTRIISCLNNILIMLTMLFPIAEHAKLKIQ